MARGASLGQFPLAASSSTGTRPADNFSWFCCKLDISPRLRLSTADAIDIVTCNAHFEGLPRAVFVAYIDV